MVLPSGRRSFSPKHLVFRSRSVRPFLTEPVAETLGCVVKDVDDIQRLKRELASGGIGRFVAAQS